MIGVSKTLWIIITAVVVLIAAVVLISFFSGGVGKAGQTVTKWIKGIPEKPVACEGLSEADCNKYIHCKWCKNRCVGVSEPC